MAHVHEITWPKECSRGVHGRNGFSQGRGVLVSLSGEDELLLQPINSRGGVTQCQIPLPVSAIEELIAALQDLRRQAGQAHPLICSVLETREAQDVGAD